MLKPMDGTYRFYVHMFTADLLDWTRSQAVVKERSPFLLFLPPFCCHACMATPAVCVRLARPRRFRVWRGTACRP